MTSFDWGALVTMAREMAVVCGALLVWAGLVLWLTFAMADWQERRGRK